MVAVFHQELADEEHQNETGQHNSKGGKETAQDAPTGRITSIDDCCIADVCRAVDADRPWGALADGYNVSELSHRHLMIMPHDLTLYHGEHGISPTEAEKPDEEESPEELNQ